MFRFALAFFAMSLSMLISLVFGQPQAVIINNVLKISIQEEGGQESNEIYYPEGTTYEVYNVEDELIASSEDWDPSFAGKGDFTVVIDPSWSDDLQYLNVEGKVLMITQQENKKRVDPEEEQPLTPMERLAGSWKVDLRPSPDAESYFQSLRIDPQDAKTFSGAFYGSNIKNGLINKAWEDITFAFITRDRNNTYYHTATLKDNELTGTTYCPQRDLVAPWTAIRK